jgi:hypothetical protein
VSYGKRISLDHFEEKIQNFTRVLTKENVNRSFRSNVKQVSNFLTRNKCFATVTSLVLIASLTGKFLPMRIHLFISFPTAYMEK